LYKSFEQFLKDKKILQSKSKFNLSKFKPNDYIYTGIG